MPPHSATTWQWAYTSGCDAATGVVICDAGISRAQPRRIAYNQTRTPTPPPDRLHPLRASGAVIPAIVYIRAVAFDILAGAWMD